MIENYVDVMYLVCYISEVYKYCVEYCYGFGCLWVVVVIYEIRYSKFIKFM